MFRKKYDNKEIECPSCHQKVRPLLAMNRTKSEFIGNRYTGNDKIYWLVCPSCKTVIGKNTTRIDRL